MTANQFLAIVCCIQLWNADNVWLAMVGLVGFLIFGFLAMNDGFKYERRLKHRE